MKSLIRHTGKAGKKGLALVLIVAMLMSICAVGFLVTASAATQLSGTIYLDISKNSNWKNKTIVASFDGSNATATFYNSGDNMLSAYVPSGISTSGKMTLTAYPAGFPIDLANSASPSVYRVIWSSASGKGHVYAWTDSNNNGWPGYQGTLSGSYYYYDFSTKYENVIFSNNGNSQSADLELMSKYFGTYGNVAYYSGSSFVVPRSTTVTISSLTNTQNLFVMNSNDSASVSKYQYNGSNIVTNTKTLYLYNPDWSTAYVTYDLSDAYQVTVPMTRLTKDGVDYFVIESTVPVNATLRFSSSATGTANSSSLLSVPNDDKVLYIMESQKYWTTISNLPKEVARIPDNFGSGIYGVTATYFDYLEDQEITNGYMNADTYTWWLRYGRLNRAISNYSRTNGIKTPLYFGNLNTAGSDVNSETATYYNYQNIANNSGSLRNFWYSVQGLASRSLISDQIYAPASNSAGAAAMPIFDTAWLTNGSVNGSGSALARIYQSYFPFVESKVGDVTTYSFDSSGGGVQNNGTVTGKNRNNSDNVYFTWNGDTPVAVNYGRGSNYAITDGGKEFNIYDTVGWGIFPFNNTSAIRQVTSSGDPVKIPPNEIWIKSNYGTVACYAWTTGGGNTGTPQALPKNGYGYFVMNTTYTNYTNFLLTSAAGNWDANKTEDLDFTTYLKGRAYTYTGNSLSNNLNYGFGIRLDMDFRVPENGTLPNGNPVTFDYAGDDDLWVYISDDAGNSELVLDLGGDHKFTSGSINFNTMKSTADYVHTNYNTNYDEYPAVPADEFWIAKKYYDANENPQTYSSLYVKTWDKTDKNGNTIDSYYVPFETSTYTFSNGQTETFFKFKTSILGTSTAITANTAQSTASEIGGIEDVKNIGGRALVFRYRNNANKAETYVVSSGSTATGKVTKPFLGGHPLNPNKTYHMTVFYMERGLIESNFKVNFTMTPVKNDLLVDKVVEVSEDINNADIADAILENDTFNYTSTNNYTPANGKTYTYTQQGGSVTNSRTGSNGIFSLKDSESAYFNSQFDTGSAMTVTENSIGSGVSLGDRYSTRWELFKNGKSIDSRNNSTTANFNLGSADDTENANMQLTYTNKLKTGAISINKKVQDQSGNDITNRVTQDFKFTVKLNMNGKVSADARDYTAYPLYYKVNNVEHYTDDGSFSFAPQDTVIIEGLPVGATYMITESVPSGYTVQGGNGKTGVVGTSTSTVGFVNKQSSGSGTVTIGKKLDGANYTGNQFSFTMQGLGGYANTASRTFINVSSKTYKSNTVKDGVVTFNIDFSEVGWYRFEITEDAIDTNLVGYSGDSNKYYVEFEVVEKNNELQISGLGQAFFSDANFTDSIWPAPSFSNTTRHASIQINKNDQAGNPLEDTQFAVIKVKSEKNLTVDQINALITANQNLLKGSTTKPAGQDTASVLFENLPVYQNGDKIYNQENGRWEDGQNYMNGISVPQTYLVFEYSAKNGYNTDKTTRFVTFPHEGKYKITFDYTNVAVVMPQSSGGGMHIFFVVGLGIMGTGALIAAAYYANGKLRRKKSRQVYHDK